MKESFYVVEEVLVVKEELQVAEDDFQDACG